MARVILLFFVLIGMALEGCGNSGAGKPGPSGAFDSKIIGGEEVRDGDPLARSTVMLGQSGFPDCSATLLSSSVLVTAAHCVDPFVKGKPEPVEGFFVKFRSPGLPVADRVALEFSVHPNWAATTEELRKTSTALERIMDPTWRSWGDVALVRFANGLPEGFEPATLLSDEAEVKAGSPVVLAGFGSRADSSLAGPDEGVLRRVGVEVAEASSEQSLEILFRQESGRGSCKGDSGGPAYVEQEGRYYLLGATSRAVGQVEKSLAKLCRQDSLYTDLRRVKDWLLSEKARLEQEP